MVEYFLWNTIAPNGPKLCYGWSDEYHTVNRMDRYHQHYLCRVADLYADVFNETTLDAFSATAQFLAPMDYQGFLSEKGDCWLTPASPLLMSSKACTEGEIQATLARLPRAAFPRSGGANVHEQRLGQR